jgi:hypothetical protein
MIIDKMRFFLNRKSVTIGNNRVATDVYKAGIEGGWSYSCHKSLIENRFLFSLSRGQEPTITVGFFYARVMVM